MEVSPKDPGIGPPSPTRGIIVGMDVDFYQKSSKTPQVPSTYEVPAWSMFSNFAIWKVYQTFINILQSDLSIKYQEKLS